MHEVVARDEDALIHGNEIELTDQLSRLIQDEHLRVSIGQRGLNNFRARFAMDIVNPAMLAFYKTLIA
jgi:hypothetical protein